MTTSEALEIIHEYADCDQDENVHRQWRKAMSHIITQLGVVFDAETEQWVTADTGDVI